MNEETKGIQFTDFDYLMADPQMQMIKAAIPYLQIPQQRILSMMIKMREFNRTRELFEGGEMSAMGINPNAPRHVSSLEILQAMKPYAGPRERDMIDMMENIQLMMQSMQIPT